MLSELMTDPFDAFFNAASAPMQAMQKMSPTLMRTDIKETDGGYELTIDLPGFKKDVSLNVSTLPDFSNGRFIQYHILSDEIKKNHCIAND